MYMRQLDGLRAFAVLAVMLEHFLPADHVIKQLKMPFAGAGVYLFFVLSGFLITGILLRARRGVREGGATSLNAAKVFYSRRMLRILPLFYLTLLWANLLKIPGFKKALLYHIFYLSNIYFVKEGGFGGSLSGHFWSLAVEEQFYLIWPWLILMLPERLVVPSVAGIVLIGPISRLIAMINGIQMGVILLPSCVDALGMGSLLAICSESNRRLVPSAQSLSRLSLLLGASIVAFFQYQRWMGVQVNWKLYQAFFSLGLAFGFTWLIFRASRGFRGVAGRVLSNPAVVYLGKISYGLYVLHVPGMWLLPLILRKIGLNGLLDYCRLFSVRFAFAVCIASLSWFLFEKPLNNLKKYFPYPTNPASRESQ